MKKLIAIVLVVSGLWFAYWFVGAWAIRSAVTQTFEAQAAQGLVAINTGVSVNGFPNRFDIRVDGIELADASAGWGWKTPFAQVYLMSWKPWDIRAALPSGQVITLPDQTLTLQSEPIRASLLFHPSLNLGLNELRLDLDAATLASDAGWSVQIGQAAASTREDATLSNTHRLGLRLTDVTLDAGLMQKLAETGLPATMAEVYLDAHASFSAPLDRHVGETRPRLTGFDLADAHVTWGDLAYSAKGRLAAGADGLAEGEIAMQVRNWRILPRVLVALGVVKPEIAPTVERALQVMAAQSPDLDVLDISLRCTEGWMYFGPLPLGPSPRLN